MAAIKTHEANLDAAGKRFALIVSRYNEFISTRLLDGATDCLVRHGAKPEDLEVFRVPGSFEVPVVALEVADSGRFDALICLGAVIRGQTSHFDFVAGQAARGVAQVNLQTRVPTIFGIITTETLEQAVDRAGARTGNRGAEAALAAIETANLLAAVRGGKKAK
jgi:6,7-dimethyl-8-ribityllumazine synthase